VIKFFFLPPKGTYVVYLVTKTQNSFSKLQQSLSSSKRSRWKGTPICLCSLIDGGPHGYSHLPMASSFQLFCQPPPLCFGGFLINSALPVLLAF